MAVIRKATLDNSNKVALFSFVPGIHGIFTHPWALESENQSHISDHYVTTLIYFRSKITSFSVFFVRKQMDQEANNKSSEVTSFGYFLPLLFFPILTLFNYTPVCLRWFARKLICLKETKIGEKLSVIF